MSNASELSKKWGDVLDYSAPGLDSIKDSHRRGVTAQLLENTVHELDEASKYHSTGLLTEAAPTNSTGASISNFDPVLIALVRRAMPNLIAYDICGVQPMTGPTGLIFAMRSRYSTQAGTEAFYNEANTGFATVTAGNTTLGQAANNVGTVPTGNGATYNYGGAMPTGQAEALGTAGNTAFPEMAFSIEKVTVTAQSRALKAAYSLEMAQDLKAIHGMDAESELAQILSTEILAEINREVVRTIYVSAVTGAQVNTVTPGIFDLDADSNGRWMVEKFKGLMFQIEREANQIAKDTRRGKGNMVICSSDVASALQSAGVLSYTPALEQNQMLIDDTGNTFVGVLNSRFRVYIDPYASSQYMVVGYKGANPMDAGLFYCPYVPLQMVRAVDPGSFQPLIGFKTRYGMVANPYAQGLTVGLGAILQNSNLYYRRTTINNLL
jgi:FlaG/FlaF family flagellin (archaellin)